MNFIPTLFFWQFWRRYTTRWVIVIYIFSECHLEGICSPFMRKSQSQSPQNAYMITEPSLDLHYLELWPWNLLSFSLFKTLLPLPSPTPAQNISKPFLSQVSALCRLFKAFHSYPDSLSFTHFFAPVSSLSPLHSTFAEASWVSL